MSLREGQQCHPAHSQPGAPSTPDLCTPPRSSAPAVPLLPPACLSPSLHGHSLCQVPCSRTSPPFLKTSLFNGCLLEGGKKRGKKVSCREPGAHGQAHRPLRDVPARFRAPAGPKGTHSSSLPLSAGAWLPPECEPDPPPGQTSCSVSPPGTPVRGMGILACLVGS